MSSRAAILGALLAACLILFASGCRFDPDGIVFASQIDDHRQRVDLQ